MNPLDALGLTATQAALATGMMMPQPVVNNGGRYLAALAAVANGYRAPKRSVRIREDRSITLYKGLGQPRVSHDSLKERAKFYWNRVKCDPFDAVDVERYNHYNDELQARRAGNPTEGFEV